MQKILTANGPRHGRDIAIVWLISQHQLYAAWASPGFILSAPGVFCPARGGRNPRSPGG
jgi:hypothetical protein